MAKLRHHDYDVLTWLTLCNAVLDHSGYSLTEEAGGSRPAMLQEQTEE